MWVIAGHKHGIPGTDNVSCRRLYQGGNIPNNREDKRPSNKNTVKTCPGTSVTYTDGPDCADHIWGHGQELNLHSS